MHERKVFNDRPQFALPKTAMLLAAGLGKRMRPITDAVPKPLVTVAGRALLDYNLDRLAEAGIESAVVNVHHLAGQIEQHCAARQAPRLVISDERDRLLDSGGGVKRALPLLGASPFFSLNADTIWLDGPMSNLARLGAAFDPARMDIILMVAPAATTIGWGNRGDFMMDQHGRLQRPAPGEVAPFVYTGAALLQPALFAQTPEVFSLNLLFDRAIARDRLFGLRMDGLFMHVGTLEAIAEAEQALRLHRG